MPTSARSYVPLKGTLGQRETVILTLKWTGKGAASPVLTTAQKTKGLTSVTYVSTGLYTVLLQDQYVEFLGCHGFVLDTSVAQQSYIVPDSVTLAPSGTGTSMNVSIYSSASAAAPALYNPADGTETVYLTLYLGRANNYVA